MKSKKDVHTVSSKMVQRLLEDSQWVQEHSLWEKLGATRDFKAVYRHSDGRILVVQSELLKGKGTIYMPDYFSAFMERLEKTRALAARPFIHALEGKLPQGEDFIQAVPELINQLPAALKITSEKLDLSEDSLKELDAAIRKRRGKQCAEPPIFPMLVAYVGEVMRLALGGQWHLRHNDQASDIWEPWIVKDERHYNPWIVIVDELEEQFPEFSIAGAIGAEIRMGGSSDQQLHSQPFLVIVTVTEQPTVTPPSDEGKKPQDE